MVKVKTTAPPEKKKLIPRYDTKTFMGVVVLREKILPNGLQIKVKDIQYTHPQYRQREIDKFSVGDSIFEKITNRKRVRTLSQNDYMHLYFSLIAVAHGHGVEMEDVKIWAKGKCLSRGITEIFGDKVRKVKDTSKLTVLEMIEFLARVEVESGIPMPDASPFQFGPSIEEWNKLKRDEIERYMKMKAKQIKK